MLGKGLAQIKNPNGLQASANRPGFCLVQAGFSRHLELTRHMFWPPFPTVSPTSQLHCQSSQQRFHG